MPLNRFWMGSACRHQRHIERKVGSDACTHARPPEGAFFVFGPRGTGKSTWLRRHFADAVVVNLLKSDVSRAGLSTYSQTPGWGAGYPRTIRGSR